MADVDDQIPHPTHIGLNIAKEVAGDRPDHGGDGLTPHPEPARVAAPVREVLPDDGTLPSEGYLDDIAAEAGETLAKVWELPEDAVVAWIRRPLASELGDA